MPNRLKESGEGNINSKMPLREMLFLADQAVEAGLKVAPGKVWGMHYPSGGAVRREKLQGVLEGRYDAVEVVKDIKPDAILYNLDDLAADGIEKVSARIRDYSSTVAYYDYERFAKFVESMRGSGLDLDTVQKMYESVARSRIRKKMHDAYGYTGRKQIEDSLKSDATKALKNIQDYSSLTRVMEALKMNWLCDDMRLIPTNDRDKAIKSLSEEEKGLFDKLVKGYRRYAQTGDSSSYEEMVEMVKKYAKGDGVKTENQDKPAEQSEEARELKEELKEYMDQAVPPDTKNDPNISNEDQDEYHTPPTGTEESFEKMEQTVLFTVVPSGSSKLPMTGRYAEGRKSYYDVAGKTWSKRKQLSTYSQSINGTERQTVSRRLPGGIEAIPVPKSYALDLASLEYSGAKPQIMRDQTGCFYIQANGQCEFSIDFLKEPKPFVNKPISEDSKQLYAGTLSVETEAVIAGLSGNAVQKALQVQQYISDNHVYPAGGNLQAAQALQAKLRSLPADQYIQAIDQSKYLECYSTHLLFIAMMRKAGVPARLVKGHKMDAAEDGKVLITGSTGHAWAEIWTGSEWKDVDATPRPKKEDKSAEDKAKDKQNKSKQTPGQKADDGGLEPASSPEDGESGEGGEGGEGQGEGGGEGNGEGKGEGEGESEGGGEGKGEGEGESEGGGEGEGKGEGAGKGGGKGSGQPGSDLARDVKEKVADNEKSVSESDLPAEVGDGEYNQAEEKLDNVREKVQQMEEKKQELKEKIQEAKSFKDLEKVKKELAQEDLIEQFKEEVEKRLEAEEEKMKQEIKDQAEKMAEEGFMDEKQRDKIVEELEKTEDPNILDELKRQVEQDNYLYNRYEDIKEEIMSLVDEWYEYFAEKLPRQNNIEVDEDSRTRRGVFDRKAVMRPRNLMFGTVKNPRVIRPSIKPRFMASIMLDVSGSMDGNKLEMARKLLVFYCELFSRISKEYGYIRFSINTFSDGVTEIKQYEQDYDSNEKYNFGNEVDTIKARLMKAVSPAGGTDMLTAIKKAALDLNEETFEYPDYASAFYFIGDGGDGCGNQQNIKTFLGINDTERGFGDHMHSAIMLGDQAQKDVLAQIFGEEHTTVAADMEKLIGESMMRFDEDMDGYLENKAV